MNELLNERGHCYLDARASDLLIYNVCVADRQTLIMDEDAQSNKKTHLLELSSRLVAAEEAVSQFESSSLSPLTAS